MQEAHAHEDRLRRDLVVAALTQVDISTLVPNLNAILLDAIAHRIDAIATEAVAQIDLSDLGAAIESATRQIVDRAAVIEAAGHSGYRSVLYKVASETHGFVTTTLAQAAGVPPVEVRKIASRGGMTNIARGLYRVDGIDGGDRAAFAEAVLRVGDDAHLVGDSVLALHELALVNPRQIVVGTPRRVRRDLPAHIRLVVSRADQADLTTYDGIPSLTVERVIRDAIGSVMPDRLAEATRRAADDGLVRRSVATALLAAIEPAA